MKTQVKEGRKTQYWDDVAHKKKGGKDKSIQAPSWTRQTIRLIGF